MFILFFDIFMKIMSLNNKSILITGGTGSLANTLKYILVSKED